MSAAVSVHRHAPEPAPHRRFEVALLAGPCSYVLLVLVCCVRPPPVTHALRVATARSVVAATSAQLRTLMAAGEQCRRAAEGVVGGGVLPADPFPLASQLRVVDYASLGAGVFLPAALTGARPDDVGTRSVVLGVAAVRVTVSDLVDAATLRSRLEHVQRLAYTPVRHVFVIVQGSIDQQSMQRAASLLSVRQAGSASPAVVGTPQSPHLGGSLCAATVDTAFDLVARMLLGVSRVSEAGPGADNKLKVVLCETVRPARGERIVGEAHCGGGYGVALARADAHCPLASWLSSCSRKIQLRH